LLSSDPSLQSSAVKCLAAFKLPFLPHPLQSFLLELTDNSSLRSALMNIPSMFDQSLTAEQQRQQQEVQQRQATTKNKDGGKKGGKGQEIGRVDDSLRPGEGVWFGWVGGGQGRGGEGKEGRGSWGLGGGTM
jgi:hypothetical protein